MTYEPEPRPPGWTHFLGGPIPYDADEQNGPDPLPAPLEPVAESLTLQRLRAEVRKINSRYWRP